MEKKYLKHLKMLGKITIYALVIEACLLSTIMANTGSAQGVKSVKEVSVSLSEEIISLKNILKLIEEQSSYKFVYSAQDIKKSLRIKLDRGDATVEEVLLEVSRQANLQFRQVNNRISIKKAQGQLEEGIPVKIQQSVKGTVIDPKGEAIIGATVLEKGTLNGTITDIDGNFSLTLQGDNPVLVISSVGFISQEVQVNNQSVINVTLTDDVQALEEVVVVGYGTTRKRDLTGAVGSVQADEFNPGFNNTPEQLIQGKVAGVQITPGDGTPGGAVRIRIRGTTSINSSNDPLYVIDGVPLTLGGGDRDGSTGGNNLVVTNAVSFLNPDDIASIDVLKGPSATAIYGSRAANGVVMITTKSGSSDNSFVSVDSKFTIGTPLNRIKPLSAEDWRTAQEALGLTPIDRGSSTNWIDEITRNTFTQQHTISAGGGSGPSSYYASLGYTNEEGVMVNSGMERITGRLNLSQSALDDRLTLAMNLTASDIDYQNGQTVRDNGGGSQPGNLGMAVRFNPTFPVTNDDGTFAEVALPDRENWNPYAMTVQPVDELGEQSVVSSFKADLKILDFLTAGVNLAYSNRNSQRNIYLPSNSQAGFAVGGEAFKRVDRRYNTLMENTLSANKTLGGDHSINAVLGYSWQEFVSENLNAEAQGFLLDQILWNNLASGAGNQNQPGSNKNSNRLISFFGRANYTAFDKYLFTVTVRRDGSSRFGVNNKWAVFPSAALGWRISDESFFSGLNLINDLKLRAEFGTVGNQEIGNYRSLETLTVQANQYNMGGGDFTSVVLPERFANPNLKWESTSTTNIGVDFGLLESRITGSLEYYQRTTKDMILEFPVPSPSIVGTVLDNVGEMRNSGFEATINAVVYNTNDLKVELNGNYAFNKNEVLSLSSSLFEVESINYFALVGPGFVGDNAFRIEEGRSISQFYAFDFVGLTDNNEELFLDEDGNATTVNDGAAPISRFFGQGNPKHNFALTTNITYKNFDLTVFMRASTGHYIVNNTVLSLGQTSWLPSNFNIVEGVLDLNNVTTNTHEFSDRFIEDADFLKIDNVTLGYTVNTANINWLKKARVYFNVRNLAVFSKYSGEDPEVFPYFRTGIDAYGVDYLAYPKALMYTMGFNLGF